jgi:beta-glucosidase
MKNFVLITFIFFLLIGCGQKVVNEASVPTDKLDRKWWKERHELVIEKNKLKPELILIGNSILHSLDDTDRVEVWRSFLNKYNTVNMGFSGDRTENVIWRLQNGELEGIHPKLALLLIGTNNTDGNHYLQITQPKELAEATWEICETIRQKLPDTQILLLGIFPYGYKPNHRDNINNETNKIISGFQAKDSHIHYRDIGSIFLDADKKVKKSLMPDYLHPNAEGHMLMFEALENDIRNLIGK